MDHNGSVDTGIAIPRRALNSDSFLGFGSREFDDYVLFNLSIQEIFYNDHEFRRSAYFFTGDARGTDSMVRDFCHESKIPFQCFRAYWQKYGKSAGIMRNIALADAAIRHGKGKCAAFCFWDGKSPGTKHMIGYLQHKMIPVQIIRVAMVDGHWRRMVEDEVEVA